MCSDSFFLHHSFLVRVAWIPFYTEVQERKIQVQWATEFRLQRWNRASAGFCTGSWSWSAEWLQFFQHSFKLLCGSMPSCLSRKLVCCQSLASRHFVSEYNSEDCFRLDRSDHAKQIRATNLASQSTWTSPGGQQQRGAYGELGRFRWRFGMLGWQNLNTG